MVIAIAYDSICSWVRPSPDLQKRKIVDRAVTSKESDRVPMAASSVRESARIAGLARKLVNESLGNRVVTGAAGLLAFRAAFFGLSFVLNVVLARMLGASGLGVYTYALAWMLLLMVPAMLGMDQLVVREIAASSARTEWGRVRGILRKATKVVSLASLAIVLIAGIVSEAAAQRTNTQVHVTFLVALALLPLITLTRVRQCAMQGLHRVALGTLPEMVVQPAVLIAFLGITYWLGGGLLSAPRAMGLNLAACVIAFSIGTKLLLKSIPSESEGTPFEAQAWNWRRSALPLMFLASSGAIYAQADTLMLGSIKGANAVGIYGIADRGSELIMVLALVVSTALAPHVATLYATRDVDGIERVAIKFARATFLCSLPVALAFISFGFWYLSVFYGSAFTAGQRALTILSIGKILSVMMGLPGMILIMTGYERDAARAIGLSAIITILLNLVLIPRWGLEGTAIATASTTILWNILMAVLLYKRLGIHCTALGRISFRQASEA
jgi:O-antigen/teichoic acid export membrane protein